MLVCDTINYLCNQLIRHLKVQIITTLRHPYILWVSPQLPFSKDEAPNKVFLWIPSKLLHS